MHKMHIYYIFIAWTDHRSNDFQNFREGENIMNDATQLANVLSFSGVLKLS